MPRPLLLRGSRKRIHHLSMARVGFGPLERTGAQTQISIFGGCFVGSAHRLSCVAILMKSLDFGYRHRLGAKRACVIAERMTWHGAYVDIGN